MKKEWLIENREASRVILIMASFVLMAMALAITSRPAVAQQVQPCYTTHIVQPGQYIAQIARIYGVTPQAIMAANPQVTNPNLVFPGQALNIPLCGMPTPPPVQPVPPRLPRTRHRRHTRHMSLVSLRQPRPDDVEHLTDLRRQPL
ncbi:MAG: LysM domain-containing protein [Chloroflexota bacterium]